MKVADIKAEIRRRIDAAHPAQRAQLRSLLAWIGPVPSGTAKDKREYHRLRYLKTRRPKHGLVNNPYLQYKEHDK